MIRYHSFLKEELSFFVNDNVLKKILFSVMLFTTIIMNLYNNEKFYKKII